MVGDYDGDGGGLGNADDLGVPEEVDHAPHAHPDREEPRPDDNPEPNHGLDALPQLRPLGFPAFAVGRLGLDRFGMVIVNGQLASSAGIVEFWSGTVTAASRGRLREYADD